MRGLGPSVQLAVSRESNAAYNAMQTDAGANVAGTTTGQPIQPTIQGLINSRRYIGPPRKGNWLNLNALSNVHRCCLPLNSDIVAMGIEEIDGVPVDVGRIHGRSICLLNNDSEHVVADDRFRTVCGETLDKDSGAASQ